MVALIEPKSDVFALRNNEMCRFHGVNYPETERRVLGLLLRPVQFPDGPHVQIVTTPENKGLPVAFQALIACERTSEGWVWVQLSPSTKETLGTMLERWGAASDVWNFVSFHTHDEEANKEVEVVLPPADAGDSAGLAVLDCSGISRFFEVATQEIEHWRIFNQKRLSQNISTKLSRKRCRPNLKGDCLNPKID